jgi:hypothetical protein
VEIAFLGRITAARIPMNAHDSAQQNKTVGRNEARLENKAILDREGLARRTGRFRHWLVQEGRENADPPGLRFILWSSGLRLTESAEDTLGAIEDRSVDRMLRFPSAVKRDPAIDAWLAARRDDLRPLATTWFVRMRQRGGDVRELMHDGCPTACVDDAAFGYVNAFKDHVNVGFFFGALLKDPARLLEGTGKRGRHVKLRPGCEVDSAALAQLVDAAYVDIRARLRK